LLDSISLKNFKCFYGDHFITFPKGLINIRGKINGNEEMSNRSGKSSFLEAIRFALFREAAYKYTSLEETSMSVELSINNNSFKHNESASYVNEEKVLMAASKAASETLIGINEKMFLCTIGAFSDNLYGFLELKPKDQKDLLLNNFNNSSYVWEDMQSVLRDKVEDLNNKRNTIKMRISVYEERMAEVSLDMYKDKKEQLEAKIEGMSYELKSREDSAKQYMNEYKYLVTGLSELKKEKEDFMFKKERQIEKTKLIEKYKEEISDINSKLKDYYTVPAYDKRISKATKEKHNLEFCETDLNTKIKAYIGSNKKCPILNEVCPYQAKLDDSFNDWQSQLTSITRKLTESIDNLNVDKKIREEVSRYNSRLHSLSQNVETLKVELKELESNTDISVVLDGIDTMEDKLEFLSKIVDTEYTANLNDNLFKIKEQLQIVNNILTDYKTASKEVTELNKELYKLDVKLKNYTTALKLVSPRGIPYLLLTKVLEELEMYTNRFLEKVGMKVYVNGYLELKSLEDYCSNDGYKFKRNDIVCPMCNSTRENKLQEEITVTSADTGVVWQSESSGGKALIALAVRFALLAMAKERKCIADFMILDEIFTNLDLRNKLATLEMIKEAAEELDIKQIFIVTHDELKDIIPTTFIVNNVGGRSTIKQV